MGARRLGAGHELYVSARVAWTAYSKAMQAFRLCGVLSLGARWLPNGPVKPREGDEDLPSWPSAANVPGLTFQAK